MKNARVALDNQVAECQREQASLGYDKRYSNNNLAGAVRDSSIAKTMEAAATMCAEKIRLAENRFKEAWDYCEKIESIPAR